LEEDEIPEEKIPFLTICFRIIENSVQFLSIEPGKAEWSSFPSEVLTRIGEAFKDIFTDVLFFIRNNPNIEINSPLYQLQENAVRITGHWLVQETEALRKDVEETLSAIMLYLERNPSLLESWLSVFPSLTAEDSLRQMFVQNSGVQLLVDYICKNGPSLLSRCEDELKRDPNTLGDSSALLTNSFDVLLNVMCLAQTNEQQSQLASSLLPLLPTLKTGIVNFANLPLRHAEYFALYAHFVSLALIILRQLPPSPRPELEPMFLGIVTFFNKVGVFKEADLWDTIGDLWTLAVGGLNGCFSKYPKLKEVAHSDFGKLLKSGTYKTPNKDLQNTLQQLYSHLYS